MEFGLSSDGSKSARDHLDLFGGLILALRTAEVNGRAAGLEIEDSDA
jgi:hypothetical protein